MNIYTFNEYNLNMTNWRTTIDTALVTCLNKEITNNSFKATRWLVQAILADVDVIKYAFVSRKDMNVNSKHVLVATHTVSTANWAKQLSLNMDNLWSNLMHIVREVESQTPPKSTEAGAEDEDESELSEYVLLKDFNRMAYRLYKKDTEEEAEEDDETAAK